MTREIKVLDGTTLQPISSAKATFFGGKNNAELKFYDKEGKLYNPSGNKSDSQGIMIVEEPMGHLGATFRLSAPVYSSETLMIGLLEDGHYVNNRWVAKNNIVYLLKDKSIDETLQTAKDLASGKIVLDASNPMAELVEKEKILKEAKTQLGRITGILDDVFQGVSASLSARISSVISTAQKLSQSSYANVREGATQLLNEAQDLTSRVSIIEKDLKQIIKDYEDDLAKARAEQLASLRK